ncbi:sec63-domain-containing protein [Ceraceosorus bombacis]|uniref:Sec63-domain-containing protein n=1 Tax=Ceraceosorus bombacis TaxID=401625 RepID=A0A0P1BSX9_9BASI|nr:sec63-domain-containing protein [Ceraceosorus bombacis]
MTIDPRGHGSEPPVWRTNSLMYAPDAEEINALSASIEQLPEGSRCAHHGKKDIEELDAELDEEERLEPRVGVKSLWDQLLEAACSLDGDDLSVPTAGANRGSESYDDGLGSGAAMSEVQALDEHLEMNVRDSAVAAAMRSTVLDALSSKRSSDEVSAELAEALGWDALGLVERLLSKRPEIQKSLLVPQYAQRSQAVDPIKTAPSFAATHTGLRLQRQSERRAQPYVPGSQIKFQSSDELANIKRAKAEARKFARARADLEASQGSAGQLSLEEMERIREEQLAAAANRPLFTGTSTSSSEPQYPHVFSSGAKGNILSTMGQKFALPAGTTRTPFDGWEEVMIPPPKQLPFRDTERLISISELPSIFHQAFPGYKSLNRLQSAVYPLGFGTNENLLVCAPTGAGKTDVAMLTVLRTISQYADETKARGNLHQQIRKDDFKIIYVAPMKALASEIVRKFSKRLAYLGVKVRELTGDMQLTRQEIAETQMIVTTPEKWDVVTRKPSGEGELASKVKLLIIDEVHLLHEERGAVIETIVARTLRLVESSQSLIRIVGLSATLPNYVDVADFLHVNRMQGLFYFDSSFRPVPLKQHFLGIKGKAGSPTSRANLDKAVFKKVSDLLGEGHQVMIFVHARKETVKTGMALREAFRAEGLEQLLQEGKENASIGTATALMKKDVSMSRNKELRELFESGIGIHHAGMLRPDRNLSERLFENGLTRILCCTSTLAWGVNLPAYAVLIKGTEVYDSSVGRFVDLSILDVLQIFGRAGRPQYEDLGVGFICTNEDKLVHYIDAITSQHPIESKFITGLVDSLNAEVALGTVTSLDDGQTWLSYTYMFTRMRRNPLGYGMGHSEVADDPQLGAKRLQLIQSAARRLAACRMCELDETAGHLAITDLGRIAAKYYIPNGTIEIFNEKLKPRMTEADVLSVLSLATDFAQIIPRDSEEKELKKMQENAPCEVPGGYGHSPGKVNVLLQAYISKVFVEDFALVSDSMYVAQNAGRIIRALMEIALSKKWAMTTTSLIAMSKAVERRMWPFEHPLALEQSKLTPETVYNITRWADEVDVGTFAKMSAAEVGDLIHMNERQGGFVRQAARHFPTLTAKADLRPLTYDLLRISLEMEVDFEWSERLHGGMEPFIVWAEDESATEILQWQRISLRPQTTMVKISFVITLSENIPSGVNIRWISDRWLGAEGELWQSYDDLHMPARPPSSTALLELPLLSVRDALHSQVFESVYSYSFKAFNAIETQVFHSAMHTRSDLLLSAPSASGKSTLCEMAVWRALRKNRLGTVLVVLPLRSLAQVQAESFRRRFKDLAGVTVRVARKPADFAESSPPTPTVLFAEPSLSLRAMRSRSAEHIDIGAHVQLIVLEDLHMLDATYETCVTHLRRMVSRDQTRIVATTSSLADVSSLQEWLKMKPASTFDFHPSHRPSPLRLDIEGFDLPHSLHLLKVMSKPAYDRIKSAIHRGSCVVFVPSRSQCSATATELSTRSATDIEAESFLTVPETDLEPLCDVLSDKGLIDPLLHGVGICHEGLTARDQAIMLDLFDQGAIRVLVVPREACWTLTLRAALVIIMSTQYVRLIDTSALTGAEKATATDRQVVDYSLIELTRMSSLAMQPGSSSPLGECTILTQADQVDYLRRMLSFGLPLESSILDDPAHLQSILFEELCSGRATTKGAALDFLSWTYLFVRASINPSYYGARSESPSDVGARLSEIIDRTYEQFVQAGIAEWKIVPTFGETSLNLTKLGLRLSKASASDLSSLLTMHEASRHDPHMAARVIALLMERKISSADSAARPTLVTHAESIRASIPAAWLTAAHIARPDKKAKTSEDGTPAPLTNQQCDTLLLLAYFLNKFTERVTNGTLASRREHQDHDENSSHAELLSRQVDLIVELLDVVTNRRRSRYRGEST